MAYDAKYQLSFRVQLRQLNVSSTGQGKTSVYIVSKGNNGYFSPNLKLEFIGRKLPLTIVFLLIQEKQHCFSDEFNTLLETSSVSSQVSVALTR